jgi:hypothetical protein
MHNIQKLHMFIYFVITIYIIMKGDCQTIKALGYD